jgi:site-specific recombinase XerD
MDFLPPADTTQQRMWRSPLPYLPQYIDREIPDIEDIGRDDIDSFRLYLADSGLSVKTVNAYMITLRSWLKYLKKEQRETLDPTTIDLLKPPDRDVTFLTGEEVDTFFGHIPTDTTI